MAGLKGRTMTTTETRPEPVRRKPKAIEFSILFGWHAIISGAFIVAYLSGDEDTYAMHQFAGYTVLAALALRLIAAIVAPEGSPLRLRRPELAPFRDWISHGLTGGRKPLPRRPLLALMAAVLFIVIGATAGSGAVADFVPPVEDVHAALGELALWIMLAHVAIVVGVHGLPILRRASGGGSAPSAAPRPCRSRS